MDAVTREYVAGLENIYKEIFATFPKAEPARKVGYGLALPTFFALLKDKWSPGEIIEACNQLETGKAATIKNKFFVQPTELGEEIITVLTGKKAGDFKVPAFVPPGS
ncbi:MAG: hypothetical protein K8U03_04560 [Planctomycetia bacterium]|nr:hypothetical protein [Planctomycetia bacterium]